MLSACFVVRQAVAHVRRAKDKSLNGDAGQVGAWGLVEGFLEGLRHVCGLGSKSMEIKRWYVSVSLVCLAEKITEKLADELQKMENKIQDDPRNVTKLQQLVGEGVFIEHLRVPVGCQPLTLG